MHTFIKWFLAGLLMSALACAILAEAQEIPSDQYIEADKQVKPVNCWSLMYVLEGIKAQGLSVVWQAQNKDDEFQNNQVLFTNDSNMWVLLELNDTIACVLGAGDTFILLDSRYNQGEKEL
jgi:hypothetical protein